MSEFGVVITDSAGRVQGFQEKPDPAEALSDLASCMIYVLDREIFDYFPSKPVVDFARDVFPALLENDVPFHVHRIDAYWNDVGSLPEYLRGQPGRRPGRGGGRAGRRAAGALGRRRGAGARRSGRQRTGAGRRGCEIGAGVRLDGPLVIGAGCTIGAGARVKESVVLPGAEVPPGALVASAIYGREAAWT